MTDQHGSDVPRPAPWTDSPWFWLWLFAGAALVAAVTIHPKYLRRQARLENKFEHRIEVWRATDADAPAAGPEPIAAGESNQLVPEEIHSSLTPLVVGLAAAFAGSGWMLVRSRRARVFDQRTTDW